jgi:linoleoyl-CoA desaturase
LINCNHRVTQKHRVIQSYKFSRTQDLSFFKALNERVNNYFTDNKISKKGGWKIWLKLIAMMALLFVPFILLISGVADESFWQYTALWILMGFGTAGLGVNIMHDANHGTFSENRAVNNIASLVMNMLGGDAAIWRLQHNVLHHTFTNIHEADEDIIGPPMLRFSPHDNHKGAHRFQFIYAWFLYSLMTLIKLAYTDYTRAIRYHEMGLIKTRQELRARLLKIATGKVVYFSIILVLPLILAPHAWWVLVGFLIMHLILGFILTVIFQTAHVMPSSDYPLPDLDGKMSNNWAVHQMSTTTNYSPKSKIFSWFIGGLNYQVEHHLFSNISHIHYRKISKIVSDTAREYGIPYHCQSSFAEAVKQHGQMLYQLGRVPAISS